MLRFKSKKILIVDDDEDIRALVKRHLSETNCMTIEASDGVEAIDVIDTHKVDLVLCDLKMPKMSGFEVLNTIKENHKTPILLMTSFDNLMETKQAHDQGLKYFLHKPIDKDELIKKIQQIFERGDVEDVHHVISDDYRQLNMDHFYSGVEIGFPIFIKLSESKFIKISHDGRQVDLEQLKSLERKGLKSLYLTKDDYESFHRSIEKQVANIQNLDSVTPDKKEMILIDAGDIILGKIYHSQIDQETFNEAKVFVDSIITNLAESKNALNLLKELALHGDYYYAHILAVSIYSVQLAIKMDWNTPTTLNLLGLAGIFHDVGLKDFPKELQHKSPSEYTEEQLKTYRDHPIHGTELMNNYHEFPPNLIQIILQHHESCDGTGFPFKLGKMQISPSAKIIYLIDLFCHYILNKNPEDNLSPMDALVEIETKHLNEVDPKYLPFLKKLINSQ
ncbi:hypothetical protein A9Q84_10865 [Halobacteriovorax marinus]|uniref:Response regulator n=1 Tax=Halobacteriovorax marinus TaxID=97084 RepID=A0A1Y5FBJ5_9BACT|nr:hypothetical protein A9Q84_10865 [Halobacteriovorax marinus]